MIKYHGKAISWVQYTPTKPIKHGIKVYAVCCSYTGYLYGFEIYAGKGNVDGSPKAVVLHQMDQTGVLGSSGCILYTDNLYTSEDVMEEVWKKYKMLMVGTYQLTMKKSRTAANFPFHKTSGSTLKTTPSGWFHSAVKEIGAGTNHAFTVQATVWKDKKQVGFLHNHLVEPSVDVTVDRWSPSRHKTIPAKTLTTIKDYTSYFSGVDNKD